MHHLGVGIVDKAKLCTDKASAARLIFQIIVKYMGKKMFMVQKLPGFA